MHYILNPSLEHIALVRIAITLWSQNDIRNLIAEFCPSFGNDEKEWQKIEDRVIKRLPHLLLPELLKEKVLGFIKPIGFQILRWKRYHGKFVDASRFIRDNFGKLYWTPQGTIDQRKTAGVLVKDESQNVTGRYRLACIYCLEDEIYSLWQQLDDKKFYEKYLNIPALVPFWSHHIEGKIFELESTIKKDDENNTPYEYAFQHVAVSGNKAGTEYFLQKLTPEEKDRVLVRTAGDVAKRYCCSWREPRDHHVDVLCFLLTNMSEEQQVEVFRSCFDCVLECFLEWPWQDFFMKTAGHTWDFFSEEDYGSLLRRIIDSRITKDYRDYDYQRLFGVFWQHGPSSYKRHVVFKEKLGSCLLLRLFKEDKENIKLIFRDPCIVEEKELISCGIVQDICEGLVRNKRWDLLKFFIEECVPYKDIIIALKEELKKPVGYASSEGRNKFRQLLDNFIEISNKRRNTEESKYPAKKLCSVGYEKMKEGKRCQRLEIDPS